MAIFASSDLHAQSAWVGLELEVGKHGGVGVRSVVPGSPASMTNLVSGDEVLSVDAEPVAAPDQLSRAIRARPIGRRLTLRVRAASGDERQVVLAPAGRPSDSAIARQRLLDRPAPAFSLPRLDAPEGALRETLSARRGHPVLLDFWATWCGPCVRALPELAVLQHRWAFCGLEVLGLSTESTEVLRQARLRHRIEHPVLRDAEEVAFRSYGILALPTLVLVDAKGVVRAVEVGGDLDAIEARLRALYDTGGRQ